MCVISNGKSSRLARRARSRVMHMSVTTDRGHRTRRCLACRLVLEHPLRLVGKDLRQVCRSMLRQRHSSLTTVSSNRRLYTRPSLVFARESTRTRDTFSTARALLARPAIFTTFRQRKRVTACLLSQMFSGKTDMNLAATPRVRLMALTSRRYLHLASHHHNSKHRLTAPANESSAPQKKPFKACQAAAKTCSPRSSTTAVCNPRRLRLQCPTRTNNHRHRTRAARRLRSTVRTHQSPPTTRLQAAVQTCRCGHRP